MEEIKTYKNAREECVLSIFDKNQYTTSPEAEIERIEKAFDLGIKHMKGEAVRYYRDLCPSYKTHRLYECGNYSYRRASGTKKCDMGCDYIKKFTEKIYP